MKKKGPLFMSKANVKLKIADTVIRMQSEFPIEELTKVETRLQAPERFNNFLYTGSKQADIVIDVRLVKTLPRYPDTKPVFITYHFQNGGENWRLRVDKRRYVYSCPLEDKKQVTVVNKRFDRIEAYLIPKKNKGMAWNTTDIIYDFLQVLLINYFALRGEGIFTHAVGIKDVDASGMVFAGKSGAGKSTTARLWHKHSKAMVLNDDRVIVRKGKGGFVMHGSPWHGEFSDYLESRIESAPLKKLIFIHHAKQNTVRRVFTKEAFGLLYPALFPTFWDKVCLENIISFCQEMIKAVPCYSLGFVNNKDVIDFIREIKS
jgi:hypothetical protein